MMPPPISALFEYWKEKKGLHHRLLSSLYPLRACNFTLYQRIILPLQPLQRPPPFLRQFRPPILRHRLSKKSRFPFYIFLFPLRSFFALPFFELLFQFCGFGEAFGFDGCSDGGPEAEGFVGELGGERGDYFGGGEEGFEIDEEGGVLRRREVVRRDVEILEQRGWVPLIRVVCSRLRRASSLLVLLRCLSQERLLFGSCCRSLDRS